MKSIYCIKNIITNEIYVGQTSRNIKERFSEHIRTSKRSSRHGQTKLYESIRRYKKDNFKVFLLEEVEDHMGDEKEKLWVEKLMQDHKILNVSLGGKGKTLLSEKDKNDIINKYKNENIRMIDLAKEYHVSESLIQNILKNTFEFNSSKRAQDSVSKKIKNIEKDIIFESLHDAAKYLIDNNLTKSLNVCSIIQKISLCAKKKRKTAYGFTWIFL